MSGCVVWVLRDCFFSGCNEEGLQFQSLAVLPDDVVTHCNYSAETQNKDEDRNGQHPTLASRALQRRTAKDPCKKNSDDNAAHQATRMGGIVRSTRMGNIVHRFGEISEEQFEWRQ